MNNDDWLNNLAYCFGLDSGISQDNSAIPTASPDLHQTLDLNKFIEQHPIPPANDPNSVNGKGIEIPAEQFTAAWETGGNFMASTVTHPEALLKNLGGNHVDNQHLTDYNVGCKVSTYGDWVIIDGSH